ncbi:probable G-protein coupled receptor Mth-like 12 [Manduca sexta]|uniref:G-protein coupled receptors family 2 profile 2 domain-containing protein n=1 Tax=Manduca sexta TaxID=7130 RepID=A0A921YSB2_MANSE|nr:probable G-protein coupled receptor Mth-like 12 [Manduca sexta]KAG6444562.1 hypothetical protein O3G_MSEX003434 [Manduca sexta]KAG6444563.1 hypothetical protein O3G_MSEX003434 [Manduca sexta]
MSAFVLIFLFISLVYCESEVVNSPLKCSKQSFTDIQQKHDVTDYCKTNKCIAKCCPAGKILAPSGCIDGIRDFSNVTIYKNDIKNKTEASAHTNITNFKLVYDDKFLDKRCSNILSFSPIKHYILEDGSLQLLSDGNGKKKWLHHYNKLEYCMELYYSEKKKLDLGIGFHYLDPIDAQDEETTNLLSYITIGQTLTSSFFLILTLVIYYLIPSMRNINGMIQMAYYYGLIIMFILRTIMDLRRSNNLCRCCSTLYYFIGISNFVWLAVMSFNLWWSFRGTIKHRPIHRKGEKQKFRIYSLCVYGTTGALTVFATLVDVFIDEDKHPNLWKPAFKTCLNTDAIIYYFYIPIAVMISINCLLFIMTFYNIWKIRKGIEQFDASESRKNQASLNSFKIYKKISIMMGVSWILEVAQMRTNLPFAANIIVNLYNSLIGVIIFIMVISDKTTYKKLCARLNKDEWGRGSQKPSTQCSGYSGSSKRPERPETFQTIALNSMTKSSELIDNNSNCH